MYFQKPVNDLDLSEAAVLAGLIPAPSRFNPRADPGTAEIRRLQVLDAMLDEEMITFDEWNAAKDRSVFLESQGAHRCCPSRATRRHRSPSSAPPRSSRPATRTSSST